MASASRIDSLFSVRGRVALITGGATGIGLMIASGFVANGARVYICSRNGARCEAVAAKLTEMGPGEALALPADLSSDAACRSVAERFGKRESKLHVLINNSGTNWGEPIETYPEKAWTKVLGLNVKSVFELTRAMLPFLEKAAQDEDNFRARVINVGSIDGIRVPVLETYAYSASKTAVHQLTRVLASQLAPRRINVNAIAPGAFRSKMMAATLSRMEKQLVAKVPLRRIGTDTDMAGIALYLSSQASDYVTGTIIPVDGGVLISSL